MLTEYISHAMRNARYEILEDESFYGEIPGFQGVYANSTSLELCRTELQEVLEGWIVLGLQLGQSLPEIDGVRLEMTKEFA